MSNRAMHVRPWLLFVLCVACRGRSEPVELLERVVPRDLVALASPEPPFNGCMGPGDPALALLPGGRMHLDGNPIENEAELGRFLEFKRKLDAERGNPHPPPLIIQVFEGVEPGRLEQITAFLTGLGYVELNVMRDLPTKPGPKPARVRRLSKTPSL